MPYVGPTGSRFASRITAMGLAGTRFAHSCTAMAMAALWSVLRAPDTATYVYGIDSK